MNMKAMEKNKRNAQAFYELMFNQCKPREAIEQFVGADLCTFNTIQKSRTARTRSSNTLNAWRREYPGKRVTFKRVFAEGNHVILHCHQQWPGDLEYAGIDIFRFDEEGKIVEHWDVLQVIPGSSKNDNTMF